MAVGRTEIELRNELANISSSELGHAARLVHQVCVLAGSLDLIERYHDEELCTAIRCRDNDLVFDRLTFAFSFQGIADAVAAS